MVSVFSEAGVEYEHPSKYWLKADEGGISSTEDSEAKRQIALMESQMNVSCELCTIHC